MKRAVLIAFGLLIAATVRAGTIQTPNECLAEWLDRYAENRALDASEAAIRALGACKYQIRAAVEAQIRRELMLDDKAAVELESVIRLQDNVERRKFPDLIEYVVRARKQMDDP
jgi:hypothetical protein